MKEEIELEIKELKRNKADGIENLNQKRLIILQIIGK